MQQGVASDAGGGGPRSSTSAGQVGRRVMAWGGGVVVGVCAAAAELLLLPTVHAATLPPALCPLARSACGSIGRVTAGRRRGARSRRRSRRSSSRSAGRRRSLRRSSSRSASASDGSRSRCRATRWVGGRKRAADEVTAAEVKSLQLLPQSPPRVLCRWVRRVCCALVH